MNAAVLLALLSDLYSQVLAGKQREAEKDAVIAELRDRMPAGNVQNPAD